MPKFYGFFQFRFLVATFSPSLAPHSTLETPRRRLSERPERRKDKSTRDLHVWRCREKRTRLARMRELRKKKRKKMALQVEFLSLSLFFFFHYLSFFSSSFLLPFLSLTALVRSARPVASSTTPAGATTLLPSALTLTPAFKSAANSS